MEEKRTATEAMSEAWSKNKPLTLTVGALIAVALTAFTLGVKLTSYMGKQEKTLEKIQVSQAEQAERYKSLAGEIQTIKANADRMKDMERRLDALEVGVKAVRSLAELHIGLRWNVIMMEEWVKQLQEKLGAAGVVLELPNVRTIRARTLIDN